MMNNKFWVGKRVFITGHTGFKGSWLCLWLHSLGAEITGYALAPPTHPNLFELSGLDDMVRSIIADVRDGDVLAQAMIEADPEIVIHMAAQPLVRESYKNPRETYGINVLGTVNLFEAVRQCARVKAVVNVTTDKCYENKEWAWGYRENEPLGGYDPYSSSKACSELITAAYRSSFFINQHSNGLMRHGASVASARAGNVIGGGDWADDRLIPDCLRALLRNEKIIIRHPHAIRPWQHVLEPLSGYLLLAQRLCEEGERYSKAWNFGPLDEDAKPVAWIVRKICDKWGDDAGYEVNNGEHPHEACFLKLDCSMAKAELGWQPRWTLEHSIDKIVEWTRIYRTDGNIYEICLRQIREYAGNAL